jgi:hypothetical protein
MQALLKKDVRFLSGLVGEQLTQKFATMPKTKAEDVPVMQKEIENLYELKNKLKNFASDAPEASGEGE